jgi:hypothetical protein
MEESGFYKNDNGQLLFAPNYVINKNYELYRERKEEYEYPVDGWHWFTTRQEALDFFDLTEQGSEQSFALEYLKNNLDRKQ